MWMCVLTVMTISRDVSCAQLAQQQVKQMMGGSYVSHALTSPVFTVGEDAPCKHEQLPGSFFFLRKYLKKHFSIEKESRSLGLVHRSHFSF